jgi:cell division protein FtsZ
MGIGKASGEDRATSAARQAISSPLLEVDIAGAQGILFNISGSSNLSLYEVTEAAEEIRSAADPEANIIFGTSFNERLGEEVMITVIATGFDGRRPGRPVMVSSGQSADGTQRAPRDFLEELERQRSQLADVGVPDASASASNVSRPARSVVEPVPAKSRGFEADDLEIPSFLRRKG